jgi:predicted phage terminase large subunit-like protein
MTPKEQKEWQIYLEHKKRIMSGTSAPVAEPVDKQRERIKGLLANFEKFCEYYFPHYMTAKFGYFHKRDIKAIVKNKTIFGVLEWPRAHAKSVVVDVFLTLYLKALGELNGVILTSNNKEKAMMLLLDCQAELEANERYINDFGKQVTYGDWEAQSFATQDGIGFWAYGRGQSPRGTRKAAKRPNLIIVDDIDDKEICRNHDRVTEAVDWILEDLLGCFDLHGGRFVMVGNRIHKDSILANIVGDVEEGQQPKPHIYHSKVYALENPKTHREDQSVDGVPAWKENYSRADVDERMALMGYRAAQREFFHRHIQEGKMFKREWLRYDKRLALSQYQHIITYLDPSYKDTKKNDYKAIIAIGRTGIYYHILKCWVRQTTKGAMVRAHYDMDVTLKANGATSPYHYMEANMMQEDTHMPEYIREAETRGTMLPISGDKRDKGPKYTRIENMTPLFERGLVVIDQSLQNDPDTVTFVEQLLSFPTGHDDAPDALEGAIFISNTKISTQIPTMLGARRRTQRL